MGLDVTLTNKVCKCCGNGSVVYRGNITHNLNKMADNAKIYDVVWRPEENGVTKAKQLIKPLENAIKNMENSPDRFELFNAPNGCGTYSHFLSWLRNYLEACKNYPEAEVSADR